MFSRISVFYRQFFFFILVHVSSYVYCALNRCVISVFVSAKKWLTKSFLVLGYVEQHNRWYFNY